MPSSPPNPQLAKRYISYSVEDIARLFGIHRHTVREWIKRGLPVIDQQRPLLVQGADLAEFLRKRRAARKQPCAPGQMFCLRCRVPRVPAGGQAVYRPLTATQGTLNALCGTCSARMCRRVSLAKLTAAAGNLAITTTQGGEHIDECPTPIVNRDFKKEG